MTHQTQLVRGLCDFAELRQYIRTHAEVEGLGGVWCTDIWHATHPLFVPIVVEAQRYQRDAWSQVEPDDRPVQAWGIRVIPGICVPKHAHPAQRYSVLYYLSHGAAIWIEGEKVDIEPGLMLTFAGTAEHWTDEQVEGERYSVALAFG
jgi:quercetin dioxygenase-like cupin family protein